MWRVVTRVNQKSDRDGGKICGSSCRCIPNNAVCCSVEVEAPTFLGLESFDTSDYGQWHAVPVTEVESVEFGFQYAANRI